MLFFILYSTIYIYILEMKRYMYCFCYHSTCSTDINTTTTSYFITVTSFSPSPLPLIAPHLRLFFPFFNIPSVPSLVIFFFLVKISSHFICIVLFICSIIFGTCIIEIYCTENRHVLYIVFFIYIDMYYMISMNQRFYTCTY